MTTAGDPIQFRAEQSPFVMLPRWLLYHPGVGEGAKFLYCVLHDLVNGREGPTRPVTRAELAACCDVSVDTIDRRLAQLTAARAIEKHAQLPAGGQVANVYHVWLTPPEGLRRSPHGEQNAVVDNRGRNFAAPVEGCANDLVNRSREFAAPPPEPQECGDRGRNGAAPTVFKEPREELPPQPPRTAGGSEVAPTNRPHRYLGRRSRRATGTNPRALTANPRAEDDLAAAAQEADRAARLEAVRDRQDAERRAADQSAADQCRAFDVEAAALSAALEDGRLAAVLALVEQGLTGALACSSRGLTHAVVGWCRAAAARWPAPFLAAVDDALADQSPFSLDDHTVFPALALPPASPGTPPLHERIRALRSPGDPDLKDPQQ